MYLIIHTIVTAYCKKSHYKEKTNWIITVSFLTTFLSTIALGLALAIMNGFQESTEIKMKGIHSDLTIDGKGIPLHETSLRETIKQEFPQIKEISFYAIEQCLISNSATKTTPQTALFLGIEPFSYCKTHALRSTIMDDKTLDVIFGERKIIIGASMAQTLDLAQGDLVDCIIGSFDNKNIEFNKEQLIVGGVFKTGIEEFDNGVVFGSHETIQLVYPDSQVTHAACRVNKGINIQSLKQALESRLSLHVMGWQDYYPALVSAMNLESKICTLIFVLIVFMASLTNGALLLLYISNKSRDIALLQLLGLGSHFIQIIFVLCGLCIHLISSICGVICAKVFSELATHYQIIKLPEAYYIDHVVFSFTFSTALFVLFVSIIITVLTSYWATRVLNRSMILENLTPN